MAKFHMDIIGVDLTPNMRDKIVTSVSKNVSRFTRNDEEVFFRLKCGKTKRQFRKQQEYRCRINVTMKLGRFNSDQVGWGVTQAVSRSLMQLRKQILKKQQKIRS